jgi:hypothetical protein
MKTDKNTENQTQEERTSGKEKEIEPPTYKEVGYITKKI